MIEENKRSEHLQNLMKSYKADFINHKSAGMLRLKTPGAAINSAPMRGGLSLDFFSNLSRNSELIVSFHGAYMKNKNQAYPLFWRIASLRPKTRNFIAISDPTIKMDKKNEMLLSWYSGGAKFDPANEIVALIRRAMRMTGAKHVAFVGGSGGGFAALRIASLFPGSMALVQEPQTRIANYLPHVVSQYFATCWPGFDEKNILNALPERFDMVEHYRTLQPENFVYYIQSRGDVEHVEKHYNSFKAIHGVAAESGMNASKTRSFNLYTGKVQGHGQITPEEFDNFYEEALAQWREYREIRGFNGA